MPRASLAEAESSRVQDSAAGVKPSDGSCPSVSGAEGQCVSQLSVTVADDPGESQWAVERKGLFQLAVECQPRSSDPLCCGSGSTWQGPVAARNHSWSKNE